MLDVKKFVGELQDYIERAVSPLASRIKALEARQPGRGERGLQGEKGLTGDQGPRGEKGEPGDRGEKGEPGKDAEPVELRDVIAELSSAPEIKTLLDLLVAETVQERVACALPEAVAAYLKDNPPAAGKDGRDGIDGKDGADGTDGKEGAKGADGKDGIGLADALIDRDGALVLTMTDGRARTLGVVVGRDGRDGERGADGLSMAAVSRTYDADSHEVIERWTVDGESKELRYPAGGIRPTVENNGFWREGMKCFALQAITHDGALWIAKRDTAAKPSLENSADWQLAARKGRDGRDGKDGKPPLGPVKLGEANA